MSQFKRLFEPIKIGEIELKNRIISLAMGNGSKIVDGELSDNKIDFYAERAKGGAALVYCTFAPICPAAELDIRAPGAYEDRLIPGMRRMTKAFHDYGAKAGCQLLIMHYGYARKKGAPSEIVGPSKINGLKGFEPRQLDVEEIEYFVESYGEATRRAREAGFDVVEFHFGMGYLISKFISPLTNHRTDQYGGSFEKRMKLPLDIIASAKKKAGADYTLSCRFCADEFMEGGYGLEDGRKIAQILQKAGVHVLNAQGGWHESTKALTQQWVPAGAFAYLSAEVKKVTNLPVVAAYRIDDPKVAEKILVDGKADLIGMVRGLLADPEFPNKAKEGQADKIRHCIACSRCLDNAFNWEAVTCSVNASLGLGPLKPAEQSKKVLIIGGGPSGLEAARVAASRGHNVTLCEKDGRLGGLMVLGAVLNDKMEPLIKWLTGEIKSLGIDVRLNTKVTPALLEKLKPDVIILAPGGTPITPQVPGVDGANVLSGRDIKNLMNGIPPKKGFIWRSGSIVAKYLGDNPALMRRLMGLNFPIKKRVVIIGGQFAGLELALTLMDKGKIVTVIEETKRLGNDIGPTNRWLELDMLRKGGVKMETLAKLKEITPKGVKVIREGGKEYFFEADTVVLTLGLKPNPELAREFEGKAQAVYLIGDGAEGPGIRRIREAIASGFEIGSKI